MYFMNTIKKAGLVGMLAGASTLSGCALAAMGIAGYGLQQNADNQRRIEADRENAMRQERVAERAQNMSMLGGDYGELRLSSTWTDLDGDKTLSSFEELGPNQTVFGPNEWVMGIYVRQTSLPGINLKLEGPKSWSFTKKTNSNRSFVLLNDGELKLSPGDYTLTARWQGITLANSEFKVRAY